MKNKGYIVFFLIVCLSVFFQDAYAQISDENTYLINQYFQLNKQQASKVSVSTTNTINQSQINIVTLNQIGNDNDIEIKSNANNSQQVTQQGNQNYYNFINYYNNNPSNFNILQQGTSNSLQIYGQNSIIENITIIQKTNAKTLIIKNQ
ncbi:hypothetical protein ACFQ5N_08215 [Lutibacter holmesii]|uniref:Curlin associated repeat-containing protein n=1 Tax=Lutibacter holmesii TaxID=1137985 RepID=A0ABW3WRD2_9FLAO